MTDKPETVALPRHLHGGRLGLVLPMAVLTHGQCDRPRRGSFHRSRIGWEAAWVMNDNVQPLFPAPSRAVFGRRTATSRPLPENVRVYSGNLPLRDAPEEIADRLLKVTERAPALETARHEGGSPYRKLLRNGATLFPRLFVFVERKQMGRLGADPSAPFVVSRRNNAGSSRRCRTQAGRVRARVISPSCEAKHCDRRMRIETCQM